MIGSVIVKALALPAIFGVAMYGFVTHMSGTVAVGVATGAVTRVTVATPVNWSQILAELVPVVMAFLVAAAAYLKAHSNSVVATQAGQVASSTATHVESLDRQVNGNLTQALQRISNLEGQLGQITPLLPAHVEKPPIVPA